MKPPHNVSYLEKALRAMAERCILSQRQYTLAREMRDLISLARLVDQACRLRLVGIGHQVTLG